MGNNYGLLCTRSGNLETDLQLFHCLRTCQPRKETSFFCRGSANTKSYHGSGGVRQSAEADHSQCISSEIVVCMDGMPLAAKDMFMSGRQSNYLKCM